MHRVRSAALLLAVVAALLGGTPAFAQEAGDGAGTQTPGLTVQLDPDDPRVRFGNSPEPARPDSPEEVQFGREDDDDGFSRSVTIAVLLGASALLPSLLLLMTTFTRFIIVLGLAKNALALQTVPPAQVLVGLALFLTMFTMGPVFSEINEEAVQPFLAGQIEQGEALSTAWEPMRTFMLSQARTEDVQLFTDLSTEEAPASVEELSATTLIPAYVISELRAGFIIGFIVFVPFLLVDIVVAAVLMSMGMVMVPPVFISLPIKLLLFVLVDGWVLMIGSMVQSVTQAGVS